MRRRGCWKALRPVAGYLVAAGGVAAVTVVIGAVLARLPIANLSMLYLLVVLLTAVWFGRGAAIFASVAAFITFDWFHLQPLHTFTIGSPEEWIALLLFLVVAVVTGELAAALRRRAEEAQRREREAVALRELSRILNATDDLDQALQAVCAHLRAELALAGCAVLLPERGLLGGRAVVRASAGVAPPPAELATAEWMATPARLPGEAASEAAGGAAGVEGEQRWVRIRSPTRPRSGARHQVRFVPLVAGERQLGMLRLVAALDRRPWTQEEEQLIHAAAEQIGRTVERARLRQAATEAEVLRKAEQVRQAVLASVSHDLRTPLASIKGAAESLAQREIPWNDDERAGFAATIVQEAGRLSRLVDNLLDMSRIEAGRLRPDLDWYPLDALVDDVLSRLESLTTGHIVRAEIPPTLPPVPLDYVQISQVLANLVENAVRYTPPGTEIHLTAGQEDGFVRVDVHDNGPGIPAEALPHVFEKFYRVLGGDRASVPGTGLGLAIARGFIEAHGGTISVQSPPPGEARGTVFTLRLPLHPVRPAQPAGGALGMAAPSEGGVVDAAPEHAAGATELRR